MTHHSDEIIAELRKAHEDLYDEVLRYRASDNCSAEVSERLAREVSKLLDKLETLSPKVSFLSDYTWLINASLQWQAFATLLNIDRRIKIPKPPDGLRAPTQRLEKENVDQWLFSLARQLSTMRQYREFIQRVKISDLSPIDEYNARVYLCRDIVGDATDFVEKVPPEVYWYLEEVWFRDIIELEAYFIWKQRGAVEEWPVEFRKRDFLEAREKYRKLLFDQNVKRGPEKFFSIRDYLTEKCLDGKQRLRPDARHNIIRIKAEQMAKAQHADSRTNWEEVAPYVDGFYNNIVAAVMRSDRESVACVRHAILRSEGKDSRASIMNVFEAAICIYFLRGLEYDPVDWGQPT